MAHFVARFLIFALICALLPTSPAESRHLWQKMLGGGGKQGGGGGPLGKPPSVAPASFTVIDPPIVGATTVGIVAVANSPLTKCEFTAGNGNNNYSTAPVPTGCSIGITDAGHANLITSHTDTLTLKATNAAGTGSNTITVIHWALPIAPPATFVVTPPVTPQRLGTIQTQNMPQTLTAVACGGCVGFFSNILNPVTGVITIDATAAASAVLPGQTYTKTYTLTNPAGTVNGSYIVTSVNNLPIAQPKTCNIAHAALALNVTFCDVTATNNPTSFTIESCAPNCAANFQIATSVSTGSSLGQISFKSLTGIVAGATYTLQVTATNPSGKGSAAAVSIIVGPDNTPAVVSGSFPTPFDNIVDGYDIAQVAISNGVAVTSWSLGGCTIGGGGNCAGFFTISNAAPTAGHIFVVASSNISRSTSYDIVAKATNADGTGQATQHITVDNGNVSPPVVSAITCTVSVPVAENAKPCPAVPATNQPVRYSIAGCGGYFDIDIDTGIMFVTAAGAAAADLNSTTTPFTCHPTVTATNDGGSGHADQTINSFHDGSTGDDGSSGSTCDALQLPNLFATGSGLVAIEVLQGGERSDQNTQWAAVGGTLAPGGLPALIRSPCASGTTPTCWEVFRNGTYTNVPPNPVTYECVAACTDFGVARPARPVTGNSQWFCPH